MYFILSGDGGGIRGVLTARIVQRLSELLAKDGINLLKSVDMFTGASTGGILAGGYAYGLNANEVVDIYATRGEQIFYDSVWDDIVDIGGLAGAEFSTAPLRGVLESYFGDVQLGDLPKTIHIPTCQCERDISVNGGTIRTSGVKFYHNWRGDNTKGEDLEKRLVDVLLYTSAAPTYFPIVDGHFDGGVAANNPTDCAIAFAKRKGIKPDDMMVLSIGTGVNPRPIKESNGSPVGNGDWGYKKWLKAGLIQLMMELPQGIVNYRCDSWLNDRDENDNITNERYHRVQAILPRTIDLASSEEVPALIELANNIDLRPAHKWVVSKLKATDTGVA